jgi:hypothetical protein
MSVKDDRAMNGILETNESLQDRPLVTVITFVITITLHHQLHCYPPLDPPIAASGSILPWPSSILD